MDSSSSPLFTRWIENMELDLNEKPISNHDSRNVDVDKWIDEIEIVENVDSPSGAKDNGKEEDMTIGYYSSLVTSKNLLSTVNYMTAR
jgi:hypothetical protein